MSVWGGNQVYIRREFAHSLLEPSVQGILRTKVILRGMDFDYQVVLRPARHERDRLYYPVMGVIERRLGFGSRGVEAYIGKHGEDEPWCFAG